ncbi:MAG: nuclear transport factor 2 family protein [Candidatus Competibacteraceae bacterium]
MTNPCFATPFAAESAFYAAFEAADVETMMLVWEDSELITCIHPLGAPLQGPTQLRASWQQIFATGTRLRFRISTIRYRHTERPSDSCRLRAHHRGQCRRATPPTDYCH